MRFRNTLVIAAFALAAVLAWPGGDARAMTMNPPLFDFTVNPGDVIKDVVRVYNEDPFVLELKPSIFNFAFKQGDETVGAPDFYPADEVRNGHELAPWTVLDQPAAFAVAPNERLNIPFTIAIPQDAPPGGYFGAINFGTVQGEKQGDEAAIGINASTAILIFLRVNGDVREELDITEFRADRPKYSSLPVDFTLRLENTGSVHLRPTGNIFVKDMFGRQVASLQVNPDFRAVLPSSARRFDLSWMRRRLPPGTSEFAKQVRNFGFGKYTADLVVSYGQSNSLQTASVTFWVVPWMVLIALVAILVAVLLTLRFGFKWYDASVIRRYEAMRGKDR